MERVGGRERNGKGLSHREACRQEATGPRLSFPPLSAREVPQIQGEEVPQRLHVTVGNWFLPHGIYPEAQGQSDLLPPLEEAQAHFFFHGLGSREPRSIEVTRPYGYQIPRPVASDSVACR